MDLYKIMLVDDEEEVRTSIIKKIDWNAAGFEVVGDAENGEDALEKVEQLEPDVVITDIRMPYMDGLTLTEKLHHRYPSMKVLIFSGFDDFEYAQKAIKLNVTEYILKPVNVKELTAILKKVKINLDEEIKARRNIDTLRENYRQSLPILREQFLNSMVKGNLDNEYISSKLAEYGIDIDNAKKWVIAVVDIESVDNPANEKINETNLHNEKELIPISVTGLLEEKLKAYCRYAAFTLSIDMKIVIIAAIDENNSQTGLTDVLRDICRETEKMLDIKVTIGIGNSCNSLSTIEKSLNAAIDALGYKTIVGVGSTVYINDVEPVNSGILRFDSEDEAKLIQSIKFGPEEHIREIVGDIIKKAENAKVHSSQQQAYMLSVMNCIVQLLQQYEMSLTDLSESSNDYLDMLDNIHKRENFGPWLLSVAINMNISLQKKRDTTAKRVIEEAKQYILEHYKEPELSVEIICRELHMSPAYFSTLFKKETGQTYTGYLTDVRLNKAVELLNKTDDKTYVIAAQVGYQEQNYFSYVFKKKFGVSPTKYRGV